MEDGPNLLRVCEKGRDKWSLNFKLIVGSVIVRFIGHDGGVNSFCLIVIRSDLGVIHFESGVTVRLLRDEEVSNDVNEGNTQHSTYAGQDGHHLFECLSRSGEVEGDGGVLGLLFIGSPTILKSLLLLEQIESIEHPQHKQIRSHTDPTASLVLVSDPKGH